MKHEQVQKQYFASPPSELDSPDDPDSEGLGVDFEEGKSALGSLALRVSLLVLHFAAQLGEFEGALTRKERVWKGRRAMTVTSSGEMQSKQVEVILEP